MATQLPAWLTTWDLRLDVSAYLAVAGLLFTSGWIRLRRRGQQRLATGWRLSCYWSGLILLGLALMSALDVFGGQLFFVHMLQHLVMVMIVPPLLWLANPFPFVIWGLPEGKRVGEWLFASRSRFRRALRAATRPAIVWFTFVALLWGWHDPTLYSAAQGPSWLHDLEHLTLFSAAMLSWWQIIGAGPRLHKRLSPLARVGYLVETAGANMIPGVIIALADVPLYPYYVNAPRLSGLSVMQDQVLSGIIMWIPGTMMYLLAALIILLRMLNRFEAQAVRERRLQPIGIEPGRP
jgi:cytochrome c oxidase assembly factor CtaG